MIEKPKMADKMGSKMRYGLYAIVCLDYFCNGLSLSLLGPAVKDLALLLETSEEQILFGFTVKSFANGVASLVACHTFKRCSRQFQYTFSILLYGLSIILLPHSATAGQYLLLSACFGIASAYIDLSTNLFVFELFQHSYLNFHVQSVHFCFAIGQTVAPQLLGPFLAASALNNVQDPLENQLGNQSKATNYSEPIPRYLVHKASQISIPFAIAGCLYLLCALAMLACWLFHPYVAPERSMNGKDVERARKRIESSGSKDCNELLLPNRKFYAIFVASAIAFSALEGLAEYQYLYLTPIFLIDYLRLSNGQSTTALFLLGVAYIVGRGLNVLVSALKVSISKTICLNILLLFAGAGLIVFVSPASDNRTVLTGTAVILLSLGYSSLLPGVYVFIENRVNITPTLNSLMITAQTALFCAESYRMSFTIAANPGAFRFANLAYIVAFAASFLFLLLTDVFKSNFLTLQEPIS